MQNNVKIKTIALIIFLFFVLLPTYKINAQGSDIQKIIGENTPDFIAKPIISIVTAIEKFRSDTGIETELKKEELQIGINSSQSAGLSKYLKYAELYLFTASSIAFNNKLIFYASFLVIIFLILRFGWGLIP